MADTTGMLKWQSHKTVHAAQIEKIEGDKMVVLLDPTYPAAPGSSDGIPRLEVTAAPNMFARYMPVPGDYYVVYDDGYASISPNKAFEEGYHLLQVAP